MLKPLSLSVSLAVALGACSLSFAGGHLSKVMPSGQEAPSAQVMPSAQGISEGCGETCGPVAKKCSLFSKFKPHHEYTYEWVLKKKKVHKPLNLFHHKNKNVCGEAACESCGTTPSAQSWPSSQAWGAGQTLGTTQIPATYSVPQGGDVAPAAPAMEPAPAAAPPAPAAPAPAPAPPAPAAPAPAPPTASTGGLQLLPAGGN